jgi:hypothetical protein
MTKDEETLRLIFSFVLLVGMCAGVGSCKRWQYKECKKVGHGTAYCVAQTAGCFGGGDK